ncbi:hypothetical protein [Terracoccus luteus]|uniref:Uncharacterized protein n=1 Tax=Terracoccus luteus TaxID=53356 RepID=A0A839PYT9_9MICO|nr:hypothetical protein [Terracoccus luteus]MBB2987864.1 hypothetical protein [Terracoccus luteus]MCP2173515.1 hypothetical protein [Terracoccus luteus]
MHLRVPGTATGGSGVRGSSHAAAYSGGGVTRAEDAGWPGAVAIAVGGGLESDGAALAAAGTRPAAATTAAAATTNDDNRTRALRLTVAT